MSDDEKYIEVSNLEEWKNCRMSYDLTDEQKEQIFNIRQAFHSGADGLFDWQCRALAKVIDNRLLDKVLMEHLNELIDSTIEATLEYVWRTEIKEPK